MFDLPDPEIQQVSVDDVKKALDNKENVIIIDVRSQEEVARGKIEKSINLPLPEVATKIETIVPDKKQIIYVYCLSGSRSPFAVGEMLKKGYKNVFNVKHGLLAWRVKHYPTAT